MASENVITATETVMLVSAQGLRKGDITQEHGEVTKVCRMRQGNYLALSAAFKDGTTLMVSGKKRDADLWPDYRLTYAAPCQACGEIETCIHDGF